MQVGHDDSPQTPSTLPTRGDKPLPAIRPLLLSIPAPAQPQSVPLTAMAPHGYSGWTLVLICMGIGMIAACLLVPQIDENRRQLYQCEKLKIDLDHLKKQVEINDQFVHEIGRNSALAERLALRQMKYIRKGANVLDVKGIDPGEQRSPFSLVNLAPPPALPAYQPLPGRWAQLCRDSKTRLYIIGAGLLLLAVGLVLGNAVDEK